MEEQTEKKVRSLARKLKFMFLRVEVIIGFFAMIAGAVVTVMVWSEGYFAGALMMVLTGALNMFLAVKELVAPTDGILHWQAVFFMIVRRAMFFLNIALLALVLGTFMNLI
ncbi:hypothetical protein [Fibrobacter succinogenes]|uniref:hypothetical protein n=1 Tax=Fibrobacter succinogenes TaxID=833 RepID=UPI00156423E5|nr:hypothetical protein [Fibrobacter succinogenes]